MSETLTPIEEAIRQETSLVDTEPAEVSTATTREATAVIGNAIPLKYTQRRVDEYGTIQQITYISHDYFDDGAEVEKKANVYLPYNYDENKQYNVLYLMHGIGGDENGIAIFTNRALNALMKGLMGKDESN